MPSSSRCSLKLSFFGFDGLAAGALGVGAIMGFDLADQAAAFPLVEAAPHALLLAGGDGVLETGLPHRAHRAHGLGLE